MPVSPRNNLGPNSAAWGRWVDDNIGSINDALVRNDQDQLNNNKQLNSSINVIAQQIQSLQEQQALLAAQQELLAAQQTQLSAAVDYLAGLKTVAARGVSVNSGPITADATVRYMTTPDSLGTSITVAVPTGRLLVSYGCSEVSLDPASVSTSMLGYVAIDVDGGEPLYSARVYSAGGARIGSGTTRSTVIEVSPGAVVTVRVRLGTWASGDTGTVQFNIPWISAQVIDA